MEDLPDEVEIFIDNNDGTFELSIAVLPDCEMPDLASKHSLARLVARAINLHMEIGLRSELIDESATNYETHFDVDEGMEMTEITMSPSDSFDDVVRWSINRQAYDNFLNILNTYHSVKVPDASWEGIISSLALEATSRGLVVQ